jgi:hypothetical protein
MPSAPSACGKQPRPLQELVGSPCYPGAKGVKPDLPHAPIFLDTGIPLKCSRSREILSADDVFWTT